MTIKYKQAKDFYEKLLNGVIRLSDNAFIPFDPANTDFQRFKTDVLEGAELQDADGNVMSADDAMAFISNLP